MIVNDFTLFGNRMKDPINSLLDIPEADDMAMKNF